ncbi:hypothetical protein BJ170DRAFT_721203 [Xylariales sp. AK1849]|nr:hypothetical protein BJ170DRAFT_721203 [Xylariales sp. AK1849]
MGLFTNWSSNKSRSSKKHGSSSKRDSSSRSRRGSSVSQYSDYSSSDEDTIVSLSHRRVSQLNSSNHHADRRSRTNEIEGWAKDVSSSSTGVSRPASSSGHGESLHSGSRSYRAPSRAPSSRVPPSKAGYSVDGAPSTVYPSSSFSVRDERYRYAPPSPGSRCPAPATSLRYTQLPAGSAMSRSTSVTDRSSPSHRPYSLSRAPSDVSGGGTSETRRTSNSRALALYNADDDYEDSDASSYSTEYSGPTTRRPRSSASRRDSDLYDPSSVLDMGNMAQSIDFTAGSASANIKFTRHEEVTYCPQRKALKAMQQMQYEEY